jgi:hypothetical protein
MMWMSSALARAFISALSPVPKIATEKRFEE